MDKGIFDMFVAHLTTFLWPNCVLFTWFRQEPLNYLIIMESSPAPRALDEACFTWQDREPWPWNHWLVNTPARLNIIGQDNLSLGRLFLSSQDINEIRQDSRIGFPQEEKERLLAGLLPQEEPDIGSLLAAAKAVPVTPGLEIISDLDWCRKRGLFSDQQNSLISAMLSNLGVPQLVYGRINGNGKSQLLFALMSTLFSKGVPFIFKEVFWFHYQAWLKHPQCNQPNFARYRQLEEEGGEGAGTAWLLETAAALKKRTGKNPVLILDEDDSDLAELGAYPLVAADKDLSQYDSKWRVYDLVRNFSPDTKDIARILLGETGILNIQEPGLEETIWTIAQVARIPFYHSHFSSAYQAKLLLTLAALEGIKRKKEGEELQLLPSDVVKWKDITHLLPSAKTDDFHCEYVIFDGQSFTWDPLAKFDPRQIITGTNNGQDTCFR